ncbi:MAG TPA: type II secretion system F family protein [Sedimentisphaerales bacterium]|nr:type II secretion system F family protein [Sedimentisphaerales bacterium]
MNARSRLARAYYDLSVMLDAGVPIMRAFDIVIESRRGYFKRVLSQVRDSLSKGSSLAESMERHRHVFPTLDRMLVEAAEHSGSVGQVFKMLSEWHEFVQRIVSRMLMGLAYPFLILHAAAFTFPLPRFILGQLGLRQYLLSVLGTVVWLYLLLFIIAIRVYRPETTRLIRLPMDHLVLRIPVLGAAVYQLCISRYARAFGMLYKAGVPISESVERAGRAVGNEAVARLFRGSIASVRSGGTAWEGLSPRLPSEYRHLWQIGEESGELDQTLDKIAQISADRADLYFRGFARGFPIVIYFVIMGLMVYMIFSLLAQAYGDVLSF